MAYGATLPVSDAPSPSGIVTVAVVKLPARSRARTTVRAGACRAPRPRHRLRTRPSHPSRRTGTRPRDTGQGVGRADGDGTGRVVEHGRDRRGACVDLDGPADLGRRVAGRVGGPAADDRLLRRHGHVDVPGIAVGVHAPSPTRVSIVVRYDVSSSAATRTVTGDENHPSSPDVPDADTATTGAVVTPPGSTVPPTRTVATTYPLGPPERAALDGKRPRAVRRVDGPPVDRHPRRRRAARRPRTAAGSAGAVPTGVATSTSGRSRRRPRTPPTPRPTRSARTAPRRARGTSRAARSSRRCRT